MGMQEAGGGTGIFFMCLERELKSLNRSPHILRKLKDYGKIWP